MGGKLTLPDGTTYEQREAAKGTATWDGETIASRVLKADGERQYTLNVIYPADKADIGKALDGHRDFASKAVVEDAAWNWMRNYRQVGVGHSEAHAASFGATFKAGGAAQVVESYIYRGPDWDVGGMVVKAGDWLGGFIWGDDEWAAIKGGQIGGVSVEGGAKRKPASPDAAANLRD